MRGLLPGKNIVLIKRKSLVLTIERLLSTAQAFYSYKGDRILRINRTLSQKVDYGIPTSDARSRETLINYLNSKTITRWLTPPRDVYGISVSVIRDLTRTAPLVRKIPLSSLAWASYAWQCLPSF